MREIVLDASRDRAAQHRRVRPIGRAGELADELGLRRVAQLERGGEVLVGLVGVALGLQRRGEEVRQAPYPLSIPMRKPPHGFPRTPRAFSNPF